MSAKMSVLLSAEAAGEQWGKNALVTFEADGAVVHLTEENVLPSLQRAGRKLDSQGIKKVELAGEGWDLECIWAFVQGHRNAKPGNEVSWSGLSEADEAELQARLMATNWYERSSTSRQKWCVHRSWLLVRANLSSRLPRSTSLTKSSRVTICWMKAGTVSILLAVVQSVRQQCYALTITQRATPKRRFTLAWSVKGSPSILVATA